MDYFHEFWIGFLTGLVINKSHQSCKERCPGCIAKLRSPLLHLHEQLSLLDKVRCHFEEVKGLILPHMETFYDIVQHKLPHTQNLEVDKEKYCYFGTNFLLTSNPDSIYWGRFITEFNDGIVLEMLKLCSSRLFEKKLVSKKCKK